MAGKFKFQVLNFAGGYYFFKKLLLFPQLSAKPETTFVFQLSIKLGTTYNQPVSISEFFCETSICFLRCLHVSNNSSLLFNMVFGFSVRITSFSVKQRSHSRPPLENVCPLAFIDHLISYGILDLLSYSIASGIPVTLTRVKC